MDGIERPLNAENKGYEMLLKMGWKQGKGLGKEQTGRTKPIIAAGLKNDRGRTGIGVLEAHQRAIANLEEAKIQLEQERMNEFRNVLKFTATCRAVTKAALRARHAIQTLDERRHITRHILWPSEDNEEEHIPPHVQLHASVAYLLNIHCYSLYRGTFFD
mmetsp:Transcript_9792/g.12073  ORF Transcript_9792/g.12073 Transcript_9792/m.12073 type:complete len:160 (+) Transcript_9792:63-542(+)